MVMSALIQWPLQRDTSLIKFVIWETVFRSILYPTDKLLDKYVLTIYLPSGMNNNRNDVNNAFLANVKRKKNMMNVYDQLIYFSNIGLLLSVKIYTESNVLQKLNNNKKNKNP